MNKQTFKKIGSVFAACAVLASSLSVTAFAQDTATSSGIDYLINETFDDLKNGGNGGDNDRISKWRIEGGTGGWNGDLGSAEMSVEASVTDNTNTMTNALKLANTANIIRGGRGWTEDKYIQPGETLTVEYEIMATETAQFIFNITSEKRGAGIEDSAGDSTIFFIKPDNENIYYYNQTQRDDNSAIAFKNVKFKHNEINKVKAEYKINDQATVGTTDTLTLTVTNSAGTKSETVYPNYRYAGQWAAGVTAIRGIGFFKGDKASTVYLDNIKAYKAPVDTSKYYLFKENFDTFTKDDIRGNDKGATDSRWRIEGGTNGWNGDLSETELSVADFTDTNGKTMTKSLKMKNTANIIRGGKKLDNMIGGKEPYTIDLDLYVAEDGQQFSLSHVGSENDGNVEEATNSYYFILWNDTADDAFADDTNIYYPQFASAWYGNSNKDRANYVYKTEQGENLKFKRGEWNHITVEYNYNNNSNQITLTVDNTYGKQVSVPANINCSTENPLQNGLKGVSFMKWDTVDTVYMDNLEVSRQNVTLPTINKFTTTGANADVDSSSVQVEFNQKMNEDSVKKIHIMTEAGAVLETTAALDEAGKVYTLTGNFERGAEYKIVVPATVADYSGVTMSQTTAYKFVPSTAQTTMTVDKVTTNAGDGNGAFKSLKASAIVSSDRVGKPMKFIIAGYDVNDKLTGVLINNVSSATAKANVYAPAGQHVSGGTLWGTPFKGIMINGAVKYKVFLWDDIQALVGNASGDWN